MLCCRLHRALITLTSLLTSIRSFGVFRQVLILKQLYLLILSPLDLNDAIGCFLGHFDTYLLLRRKLTHVYFWCVSVVGVSSLKFVGVWVTLMRTVQVDNNSSQMPMIRMKSLPCCKNILEDDKDVEDAARLRNEQIRQAVTTWRRGWSRGKIFENNKKHCKKKSKSSKRLNRKIQMPCPGRSTWMKAEQSVRIFRRLWNAWRPATKNEKKVMCFFIKLWEVSGVHSSCKASPSDVRNIFELHKREA